MSLYYSDLHLEIMARGLLDPGAPVRDAVVATFQARRAFDAAGGSAASLDQPGRPPSRRA
jgi:hypothetical protein